MVLAEYCGLRQRDIAVSLEGAALVIAIDRPQGKGVQRVELPCEVAGQPSVSLAKGVLKIQVRKINAAGGARIPATHATDAERG